MLRKEIFYSRKPNNWLDSEDVCVGGHAGREVPFTVNWAFLLSSQPRAVIQPPTQYSAHLLRNKQNNKSFYDNYCDNNCVGGGVNSFVVRGPNRSWKLK